MIAGPDPRLRILTYNTHVGTTLRGAVRFLLDSEHPDIVVLQEVQSPMARATARLVLPPHVWSAVGTLPPSTGRGSAGTLVFGRRTVLEAVGSSNELITRFHDSKHPERRLTTARLRHRATGRVLDVGGVHLWTLVARGASPAVRAMVRDRHLAQLAAYAESARRAREAGRLPFRVGDFNERMSGRGGTPAERAMRGVGLLPARPAGDHEGRIDEIFGPPDLEYDGYRAIRLPSHFAGVEGPHRALVVDVAIPALVGAPGLAHAGHAHP